MSMAVHPSAELSPRRVIVASLIGMSFEWYDLFLYGSAAALVFGKLFFPHFASLTGTRCWRSRPTPWGSSPGPWAACSSGTSVTGPGAGPFWSSPCC